MKKAVLFTVLTILAGSSLGACSNTVHGAGEDIEHAGESVQRNVPDRH